MTHDEAEALSEAMRDGFTQLNARFDRLDERTREVEQDVAVLKSTHTSQRSWVSAIVSAIVSATTSLLFSHKWQ